MPEAEFWSGVLTGVVGTVGFCIVVSLLVLWALVRNAPTVPENWDV